ncbi:NUDIX hydrolase [Aquabacter sediminis]|uniref:NUDIX hydrolase n=1 Tax=Aquabacter sediminis TaxID=3029197 RepID=UPI0031588702
MADTNGTYRVQYAALPYRVRQDGEVQLRLVTSRETRRWVIPKGWPMKGIPPHKAAAREAYEEAGLLGSIASAPLGIYRYDKRLSATRSVLCEVMVFPMKVKRYLKKWPERSQRVGFWFSIETAASVVQEPELASLILEFGTVMAERHAQKLAKQAAAARAKAEADKPTRAAPKKKAVAKTGGDEADAKKKGKTGRQSPAAKDEKVASVAAENPSLNALTSALDRTKVAKVTRALKRSGLPLQEPKEQLSESSQPDSSVAKKKQADSGATANLAVKTKGKKKPLTLQSGAPEPKSAKVLRGAVTMTPADAMMPDEPATGLRDVPSAGKGKRTEVAQLSEQLPDSGAVKATKNHKPEKPAKAKKRPIRSSTVAREQDDGGS